MKTLMIMMVVLLSGCSWPKKPNPAVSCPDIPVYTKPAFDMPVRPALKSKGATQAGEVVRDTELDVLDLQEYATKLETLLKTFK